MNIILRTLISSVTPGLRAMIRTEIREAVEDYASTLEDPQARGDMQAFGDLLIERMDMRISAYLEE